MSEEKFQLYQGNSIDVLKTLPDCSVDCCVTSPPYYALRDYGTGHWEGGDPNCPHYRTSKYSEMTATGHKAMMDNGSPVGDAIYKSRCPLCGAVRVDDQIGLEETPEEYIQKLVDVFHEVKRVLKNDGTLWVNIGDSYWGSGSRGFDFTNVFTDKSKLQQGSKGTVNLTNLPSLKGSENGTYKNKDLIGIPWMLAFALRADGWYLRQDIIWCLSGGAYIYVKSAKGVSPMMVKDLIRLDPKTVRLWNGSQWVKVLGYGESNDDSGHYELVLRSGERIGATGNHKWVLKDGTEVTTKDLSVGDTLMVTTLPDEHSHTPSILTHDALWLMGLYIAEGSHSGDCIQLALCTDEQKWLPRIEETVKSFGGTMTYTAKGNMLNVRLYSKVFDSVLSQYIGGRTSKNKHLNNICWSMPNSYLKELLLGYFDGDGHADESNNRIRLGFTRNYDLERDLRTLAARLGASITLTPTFSKIGGKRYPSFRGEWRWAVSDHFNVKDRAEIVEIRKSRARNFYDISVDCDNHLFALASGVLTHNCKPNPMPESVRDRCTKSHEYIFLLSKSKNYYFDNEAISEDAFTPPTIRDKNAEGYQADYAKGERFSPGARVYGENGKRNKRDVWSVSVVSGYTDESGSHYATYSEKLIEPCILAGTKTGGVVLDPFSGTGTTGCCSLHLGRKYIGIDLSEKYISMSERRLQKIADQSTLFSLMG